jgi:hypothetical protein
MQNKRDFSLVKPPMVDAVRFLDGRRSCQKTSVTFSSECVNTSTKNRTTVECLEKAKSAMSEGVQPCIFMGNAISDDQTRVLNKARPHNIKITHSTQVKSISSVQRFRK